MRGLHDPRIHAASPNNGCRVKLGNDAKEMTDSRADTVSIADRTHPVTAGAPVVAAHFLRHTAVFALGEVAMLLVEPDGEPRRVTVHDGAILATAAEKQRVVSGGDDGKVAATNAKGETEIIATDPKHRWIDQVALGPDRAVAWSAGKTAFVQGKDDARIRSALDRRRIGLPAERLPAGAGPL